VAAVVFTEAVELLGQQLKAVETAGHLVVVLETQEQQIRVAAVAVELYRLV